MTVTRVARAGKVLSARVWALLDDASKATGVPVHVVQGSWTSGVAASAGTHSGGGAFDLSVTGLTRTQRLALVDALRRRNVAAWLRSPEFGWTSTGPHIHGIVMDEPGLSTGAQDQVRAYWKGLNGLADRHKDPFPRPPQTPFVMPEEAPVSVPVTPVTNLPHGAVLELFPKTLKRGEWLTVARFDMPDQHCRYSLSTHVLLELDKTPGERPAYIKVQWGREGWGDAKPGELDTTSTATLAVPDKLKTSCPVKASTRKMGGGVMAARVYIEGTGTAAVSEIVADCN